MSRSNPVTFIQVWRFADAPHDLQALSGHGGDEDWLAVIPPSLLSTYIGWLESGSAFGVCNVSEHTHPTLPKFRVRIGAHA